MMFTIWKTGVIIYMTIKTNYINCFYCDYGESMRKEIIISPSLICADLCNLEKEINELSSVGLKSLHVDLIDPHFSPSMPIGLDVVKQLKNKTNMNFDVHIMSNYNEFFIEELIKMNVNSITFHTETTIHVEKMLQIIKNSGIKTGIALAPATSLSTIEYVAKSCDYILLMTINPGYAGGKSEEMVPYAIDKIKDCKMLLNKIGSKAQIIIDGRVSFDIMPKLIEAGADVLVAGSKSIFRQGYSYADNYCEAQKVINNTLKEIL